MNKERILQLADHLDNLPPTEPGFYMGSWFQPVDENLDGDSTEVIRNECGTAACIAGHALRYFEDVPVKFSYPALAAGEILDLTYGQGDDLFTPFNHMNETDPHKAARVLRHLAATGEVEWH
jgi:hypothetical protein